MDRIALQTLECATRSGLDELDDDGRKARADVRNGLEPDAAVIAKHVGDVALVIKDAVRGLSPGTDAKRRRGLLLE
jgi:hypothetical protein